MVPSGRKRYLNPLKLCSFRFHNLLQNRCGLGELWKRCNVLLVYPTSATNFIYSFYARLAQLGEQYPYKVWVGGSNPSLRTMWKPLVLLVEKRWKQRLFAYEKSVSAWIGNGGMTPILDLRGKKSRVKPIPQHGRQPKGTPWKSGNISRS